MTVTGFPTSNDIYLEVGGKKVAVVQSYSAKATKTSGTVEAFGEKEPVATMAGSVKHELELARLYATDEALQDGIDFYKLEGFSLVIVKPDKRIIYSDCQWSNISEEAGLGSVVLEKVKVVASKRIVTAV